MTPPSPQEPAGSGHRPPLTPAQRRAVRGADPATGELRAAPATRRRLEELGLAAPYGRLGAHYLTARGRELRDELGRAAAEQPAAPDPAPAAFTPASGDGPADQNTAEHVRAAVRAWEALLEIRRVTGTGTRTGTRTGTPTGTPTGTGPGPGARPADPLAVPAPWERSRPAHAVALALEAAGIPACAVDAAGRRVRTGYRVQDGPDPGTVRIEWRHTAGPGAGTDGTEEARRRLRECAGTLRDRGWESEQYLGAGRRPFLVTAPRPS